MSAAESKIEGGAINGENPLQWDAKIGSAVPDFTLTSVDGEVHKLSEFRGSKVLLCFYRFVYCPFCAYSIAKLVGNYKKLAWASRLKVVMVFRTNIDYLRKGLTEDDAPIPRLTRTNCYPFLALADTDGNVGKAFGVESKGLMGHVYDLGRDLRTLRGAYGGICNFVSATGLSEEFSFREAPFMLPSELLVDEEGVLVDVLRAESSIESMTLDRVTQFLLFGADIPSKESAVSRRSITSEENAAIRRASQPAITPIITPLKNNTDRRFTQ